ncbi:MAG: type II toxin-antitoxin system Phd/YefM family antitoxin [Gammaproteobacteria bacterium]|jgi:PHD/YefM family antitoxin component YafN of YafNO toxin-antitoxin module|nr:type II toxin-antitoxin system Phd/YefM family antitoxin [Gammaproteobacteria bacterium]
MNVVTFSELRNNLKEVMDLPSDQHEPVVIRRSGVLVQTD